MTSLFHTSLSLLELLVSPEAASVGPVLTGPASPGVYEVWQQLL